MQAKVSGLQGQEDIKLGQLKSVPAWWLQNKTKAKRHRAVEWVYRLQAGSRHNAKSQIPAEYPESRERQQGDRHHELEEYDFHEKCSRPCLICCPRCKWWGCGVDRIDMPREWRWTDPGHPRDAWSTCSQSAKSSEEDI